MESLQQRHVAILGGSAGIGLATARLAAKRGALITLGARNRKRLDEAAAGGASAIVADAEDPASLADFFRAAGPIDDLVITITRRGHRRSREAGCLGDADLTGSFAGKPIATLRAIGQALPSLSEHGSITLTGGVTAQAALAGTAEPAAVNGAVEAAVAPLARELAPRRVNAVSPGVIVTEWWDSLGDHRDETFQSFAQRTPLGRNGRPENVAAAILALIENEFITRVVLPADGGIRLTRPAHDHTFGTSKRRLEQDENASTQIRARRPGPIGHSHTTADDPALGRRDNGGSSAISRTAADS